MMTESAMNLYQAGRLDDAVDQAIVQVKNNPSDTPARFQLAQLSCIAGDLDRADRQLDTISNQDVGAALTVALIRQLIRAELSRRECFAERRVPEFIGQPSACLQSRLRALSALRDGDTDDAAMIIQQADDSFASVPCVVNGKSVDQIRDLDDLLAPLLEVHTTTGKYFWIEWNQILSVEVHPPKQPLDLLWRQASISIESGPDGDVYLPAIYLEPDGRVSDDQSLRLGRSTDWIEVARSIVRGRGQKTLLAGDTDLPLMQLQTIEREES